MDDFRSWTDPSLLVLNLEQRMLIWVRPIREAILARGVRCPHSALHDLHSFLAPRCEYEVVNRDVACVHHFEGAYVDALDPSFELASVQLDQESASLLWVGHRRDAAPLGRAEQLIQRLVVNLGLRKSVDKTRHERYECLTSWVVQDTCDDLHRHALETEGIKERERWRERLAFAFEVRQQRPHLIGELCS